MGFAYNLLHKKKTSVYDTMLDRLIALLPAAVAGCVYFGYHAVLLLFTCVAAAVVTEWLLSLLLKTGGNIKELTSVVTGLLIGMCMPPSMPLVTAAAVTVCSLAVARVFFGGYGCEIVNPAALGAALSFVSFPSLMSTFNDALSHKVTDIVPLTAPEGTFNFKQLLFGAHAGAIGEVSALFLLVGAVYLFVRRVYTVTIPLSACFSVALFSLIFRMDIPVALLGGGLLLSSIFILPEESTSPQNVSGQLAFGFVFGIITVLIRRFGSATEGVYFAVLAVNLLRPLFSAIPDFKIKGEHKNEA